jgi:two-component system chemotaxis response regulator CheB
LQGHDIIVVGASAGGVEALSQLARGMPRDLPAAVFIVLHVSARSPSIMPSILSRAGALPAAHAVDGMPIEHGRIYVAPPDHHMLVERGRVRVLRGPKENRSRPAVDPLFRSAAVAYGPRVVGVILTGALDDGTHGMRAVKRRGGTSVVQELSEALYPGMPRSVIRNVEVDYRLPVAEMGPLLVRLSREPAEEEGAYPVPDDLETEAKIAEQKVDTMELLESVEKLGRLTSYTCPECHGSLWELREGELLRFRCHTGHALSAESMVAEQSEGLEAALWSALRALEEKVALMRQMAARARRRSLLKAAESFEARARETEEHVTTVRTILLNGRESSIDEASEMMNAE